MDEDTLETSKIQYSSKREHTLNNSIPNKAIRFYSNNNDNNFDTLESYANLLNLEISPETRRGYRSFERQYRLSTSTQLANASQSYFEDANNFIGNSSVLESSIPFRLGKICSNLEANISNPEVSYQKEDNSSLLDELDALCIIPPNPTNNPNFDFLVSQHSSLVKSPNLQFSLSNKPIQIKRDSLKLTIRDKCVDGVSQFFKFKKWAYTKVQRPVNDYVRAKTGERIFKSPHLIPFKRKYGFEIEPTLSDIKKEQIESVVYRWRHYNKIDFHEEFDFDSSQYTDLLSTSIIPQKFYKERFVPLPLKFVKNDFLDSNDYQILDSSLAMNNPFLPQSDSTLRLTLDDSIDPLSVALDFDKKFLADRNSKACKSIRYYVNYPLINSNIQKERIRKKMKLPVFLLGPEILKGQGIHSNNSCGYGLGYLKVDSQKMYINPTTGLFSYFVSSDNHLFNGNDKMTYFGVENNCGYYSDDNNIKYFYRGNYVELNSPFPRYWGRSPNGLPAVRRNPYYHENDFYINPSYTSIKNQAGPWKDVRASHRKRFSHLYTITKSDNN